LPEDDLIVHQPVHLSAEEATGILDGGCTALAFFTDSVQLQKGQKVLINGASGSIGTAAIQLAKHFGAEVTAVCSTKNKALVRDLGADKVLDYTKNEVEKSSGQYDVIFDTVGKLSYRKSKRLMTERGVFLSPVLDFSILISMLFISPFSKKKFKFAATGLRKKELRMRDLLKIRDLLANGVLQTDIDRVYKLEQIEAAAKYVDQGHKRGNVVLSIS
ncbi:MAG: NAD(P)-dependent alcohol dehydrogenase, partial [Bacteroidota bacterium]